MKREELIERLMSTFIVELDEHVRTLERDLLALEKCEALDERRKVLTTLFRTVHSLKGASRAVDLEPIERVCHHLESFLEGSLVTADPIPANEFQVLLAASDALSDASVRLQERDPLATSSLPHLFAQLESLTTPAGEERPAPVSSATQNELPSEGPDEGRAARVVTPGEQKAPSADATPANGVLTGRSVVAAREPGGERPNAEASRSSISLSAEKLDRLLSRGSDLVMARSRTQGSLAQWETFGSELGRRRSECRALQLTLERVSKSLPESQEMRQALGLLAEHRTALERLHIRMDGATTRFEMHANALHSTVTQIGDDLRSFRTAPFSTACAGLDRIARDAGAEGQKQVRLEISGGEIELDRATIAALRSPLIQLVRNAVIHGIETPLERRRLAKPEEGVVHVNARLHQGRVEISVADDGRGVDVEKIRAAAGARGLELPASEQDVSRTLLVPGFSTASDVTASAGRGVGLDLVRDRVEAIGGELEIAFRPGRGASFRFSVPMTVGLVRALLVRTGGELVAIESSRVESVFRIPSADIHEVEGRPLALHSGRRVVLADLAGTLGFPVYEGNPAQRQIVILREGDLSIGFSVDEFVAEEEVVIKAAGTRTAGAKFVSAFTLLSSGRVALVLNVPALIREGMNSTAAASSAFRTVGDAQPAPARLLVVDDSITTRTLEKSILEEAGFDVSVAANGREAWEMLQQGRPPDLVLSDVEMPEMDGIALTEAIRGSTLLHTMPVILLTSRDSQADRDRGMSSGANAYLVKSAFDRAVLLDVIRQFIGEER